MVLKCLGVFKSWRACLGILASVLKCLGVFETLAKVLKCVDVFKSWRGRRILLKLTPNSAWHGKTAHDLDFESDQIEADSC